MRCCARDFISSCPRRLAPFALAIERFAVALGRERLAGVDRVVGLLVDRPEFGPPPDRTVRRGGLGLIAGPRGLTREVSAAGRTGRAGLGVVARGGAECRREALSSRRGAPPALERRGRCDCPRGAAATARGPVRWPTPGKVDRFPLGRLPGRLTLGRGPLTFGVRVAAAATSSPVAALLVPDFLVPDFLADRAGAGRAFVALVRGVARRGPRVLRARAIK